MPAESDVGTPITFFIGDRGEDFQFFEFEVQRRLLTRVQGTFSGCRAANFGPVPRWNLAE